MYDIHQAAAIKVGEVVLNRQEMTGDMKDHTNCSGRALDHDDHAAMGSERDKSSMFHQSRSLRRVTLACSLCHLAKIPSRTEDQILIPNRGIDYEKD